MSDSHHNLGASSGAILINLSTMQTILVSEIILAAWLLYIFRHECMFFIVHLMHGSKQGTLENPKMNKPRALKTFRGNTKYHMTMGMHKNGKDNWLIVDENYFLEHDVRLEILRNKEKKVVKSLPLSANACKETMSLVVDYLVNHYPDTFYRSRDNHGEFVKIVNTGEVFRLSPPYNGLSPLEIATRLAVEDLNVLMKQANGEHFLYVRIPLESSRFMRISWTTLTFATEQQPRASFLQDGILTRELVGHYAGYMDQCHIGKRS